MKISSIYPVIGTAKLAESRTFYTTHFPLTITFDSDWYVSLITKHEPHFQLALLAYNHPTIPDGYRTLGQGMVINFEVADVDAAYANMLAAGVQMVLTLRSEEWGQRHFIAVDPNGLLIDVIQLIPPSEEFARQYSTAALQEISGVSQ